MPHPFARTPSKIIAVHLNYAARARERGRVPEHPSYFLKPPSSLAGDGDPLSRPKGTELLAFEGEIALVVGERAHRIEPGAGWRHIRWVTAALDAGLYDLRRADRGSNLRAKGADGFTPVGPRLLDARLLDPSALRLRTRLNGETVQDDTTDTLLFPFDLLVADLSRLVTLEPGDVILTGTPAGASVAVPGDTVEVEVDGHTADGTAVTTGPLRVPVTEGEPLAPWGAGPDADEAQRREAWGTRRGPFAAGRQEADEEPERERDAATAARLTAVSTATLSARLRARGLHHTALDGVGPLSPGTPFAGRARTLRYLPLREDLFPERGTGHTPQKQAVEALRSGEVLVMDARRDATAGTLGDVLALRALVRGAAAVVTDGAVRDSAAVAATGLPVYCAGRHPALLGRRHIPWDLDVPVACGGALVRVGDWIVGDDDGVLVIPPDIADEVCAEAHRQEAEERFVVERVAAGDPLSGLYPLGEERRREYEEYLRAGHGADEAHSVLPAHGAPAGPGGPTSPPGPSDLADPTRRPHQPGDRP